jgi:DNA mismatch repair protein MutL
LVSREELDVAERHADAFRSVGFEMDRLGRHVLAVRQVSNLWVGVVIEALVCDVLAELIARKGSERLRLAINELLSTVACRGARAAGT